MTADTLTVGMIQHPCSKDRAANLQASLDGVRAAAAQGAQLICLQELHQDPYFCITEEIKHFDRAEPVPGPATEALTGIAGELGVVVVGSVFERRAAGVYHNTAIVCDADGRLAGRYRKMHIPDDPGYHEKFYFTPGDLGFRPIATQLGQLGVLVCWDQWFPEAARLMTLAGAQCLLYPTAIGWDPRDKPDEQQRQRDAWLTVQRSHAITNGTYVLACNRVGTEPDPAGQTAGTHFWGSSFVAGPQGEILAQAGEGAEALVTVLDLARTEQVRRIWPYLRDRRIDAYQGLGLRFIDEP